MPMPNPQPDEEKDEFVDRCMGDDTMNEEFPDQSQRRAVCERQWDGESAQAIRYPLVLRAVTSTCWAILPSKLEDICHVLAVRAVGLTIPRAEIEAIAAAARPRSQRQADTIAVVPVLGTLSHRPSAMTSGGASTQELGQILMTLGANPAISAIVLDMDSPGGDVAGIAEVAATIRAVTAQKRVVAVANTLMASAAYWLASGASEIVASPSAQVGSIGVLAAHEDLSAALERQGVRVSLISAGKFKTEGNPYAPLDDEARAEIQAQVDRYYDMFTGDVARGRGVKPSDVRGGFGEGRVVGAQDAVRLGMADRVGTLDETIARMAKGQPQSRTTAIEDAPMIAATAPDLRRQDFERRLRMYS